MYSMFMDDVSLGVLRKALARLNMQATTKRVPHKSSDAMLETVRRIAIWTDLDQRLAQCCTVAWLSAADEEIGGRGSRSRRRLRAAVDLATRRRAVRVSIPFLCGRKGARCHW